jgi:hypothetical protein
MTGGTEGSMRLVSDQSGDDLVLKRASAAVDGALRELIANLLRVSRGAGAPWKILDQVGALLQALDAHSEIPGAMMFDFERCLQSVFPDDQTLNLNDFNRHWAWGEEEMLRGAVQLVASRFLGQRTQEAAGRAEMFRGLATIEKLRDQNRRALATPAAKRRAADAQVRAEALMREIRAAAQSRSRKPSNKANPPSSS